MDVREFFGASAGGSTGPDVAGSGGGGAKRRNRKHASVVADPGAPTGAVVSEAGDAEVPTASEAKRRGKKRRVGSEDAQDAAATAGADAAPAASRAPKQARLIEHTAAANVNAQLTDMLMELGANERASGQMMKASVYFRAAKALRAHPHPVTSGADAAKLHGIGPKIAKKIDEMLSTGQLGKLEEAQANPRLLAIKDLCRVHGVGPVLAAKLHDEHGVRSVEDLRRQPQLLNDKQRIGLEFLEEIEARVPREEVARISDVVQREAAALGMRAITCGSFRRGAASSGDIDILLTHPDFRSEGGMPPQRKEGVPALLAQLVRRLWDCGLLTHSFADGVSKFMGLCVLPAHAAAAAAAATTAPVATEQATQAPAAAAASPPKPRALIRVPTIEEVRDAEEKEAEEVRQLMHGPPAGESEAATASAAGAAATAGAATAGKATAGAATAGSATVAPAAASAFRSSAGDTTGKLRSSARGGGAPEVRHSTKEQPVHRRIDLRLVPVDCYPCAVLYFTGSDMFNKQMREVAQQRGLRLNEYSLSRSSGKVLEVQSEEDVFKHLGMTFVPPEGRNI